VKFLCGHCLSSFLSLFVCECLWVCMHVCMYVCERDSGALGVSEKFTDEVSERVCLIRVEYNQILVRLAAVQIV